MELRLHRPDDRDAVRSLLADAGLPVDDLDHANVQFIVAIDEGVIVGVVGIESFERAGLLRSLAVRPGLRESGIGGRLVDALEAFARERGIDRLLLLTQTAAPFFGKRGYRVIDRNDAPDDVCASAQFRSLCPQSATCMAKQLDHAKRKRVLFVCVENANRSQMAEAFARIHGGDQVEAFSAGSRPSGQINPKAVRFMSELGYDLTAHGSKSLDEIAGEFDAVITMGCGDDCPWVPARRREDWALPDPKHMDDGAYRAVRDEISARVRALLAAL